MKKFNFLMMIGILICSSMLNLISVEAASNPYKKTSSYGPNCTWYAWQHVHDKAGISLPGWGNARTWYDSAKKAGFEVGKTPRAKSVVVWEWSKYGHVGYVEKVKGDKIYVWENTEGCVDENDPEFKECMLNSFCEETERACYTNAKKVACAYNATYWSTPGDLIGYIYLDNIPKTQATTKKTISKTTATKKATSKTTTTKNKSSNSYLNSLTIDGIDFEFNKDKLEYEIVVNNETTSININATTEDDVATIEGIGTKELVVGENIFEIIVTAEDNSILTYTLKVNRNDKVTTTTKVIKKNNKKANINNYILIGSIITLSIIICMTIVMVIKKHKK